MDVNPPPQRLPGDRGHLARLLDAWARESEEPVTSGRLRRLVGVIAIIQSLDGLKDNKGRERIAFEGGAALEPTFAGTRKPEQRLRANAGSGNSEAS